MSCGCKNIIMKKSRKIKIDGKEYKYFVDCLLSWYDKQNTKNIIIYYPDNTKVTFNIPKEHNVNNGYVKRLIIKDCKA